MVQASVRALAISIGIDLGRRYKDQSTTKIIKANACCEWASGMKGCGQLMSSRPEVEPYLARFEDDWATGQILC